jgi:hypothetical protein
VYLLAVDGVVGINPGLLGIMALSSLLLLIRILVYPYNMLLGKLTLPVLLCCIGEQWNEMPLRLIGSLMVLTSFTACALFGRTTVLDRVLRSLTILLFLLDLLAPSISLLFFVILNGSLASMLLSLPEPDL